MFLGSNTMPEPTVCQVYAQYLSSSVAPELAGALGVDTTLGLKHSTKAYGSVGCVSNIQAWAYYLTLKRFGCGSNVLVTNPSPRDTPSLWAKAPSMILFKQAKYYWFVCFLTLKLHASYPSFYLLFFLLFVLSYSSHFMF